MVVLGTRLSGREFAWLFFGPFAVQSWFQKTQKDLGYRASTLRVGRVATEENQSSPKRGIKLPTFFVPDSRVPSTRMTEQKMLRHFRSSTLRSLCARSRLRNGLFSSSNPSMSWKPLAIARAV